MIERIDQAGVVILRMADGKANTMSVEFCEMLIAHFKQALDARAVVITGNARIFSAGVDLVRLLDGGAPYIREFLPLLSTMFAAVLETPPWFSMEILIFSSLASGTSSSLKILMTRSTPSVLSVLSEPVAPTLIRTTGAPSLAAARIFRLSACICAVRRLASAVARLPSMT